MSLKPSDPLLASGKILTILLMTLAAIATIIMVLLIPVLLFDHPDFILDAAQTESANAGKIKTASMAVLFLAAIASAFAFQFFRLLKQIIETVSKDAPFTIANAERISRMGWLALLFQFTSFPIELLANYLGNAVPSTNISTDFGFSLTGYLLALVLFILARVFRHGAQMRDDLEGTV